MANEEKDKEQDGGDPQDASDAKKSGSEHMIPKSRLDEVIADRDAARSEASKLKTEQETAKQEALKEQGKWKELAEERATKLADAEAKANKVDDYEKTLKETLTAQLAELAPEVQALVPEELTTPQKLSWLAKNKATLQKPMAMDIGSGKRGGGKQETKIELTPEQLQVAKTFGYTPEEYAHFMGTSSEPFKQTKE
jgi:hypothetical protein